MTLFKDCWEELERKFPLSELKIIEQEIVRKIDSALFVLERFLFQDYIFKCRYCYRRFKLKHHLQRHERTHDLSLVHICNRCSSSFRLIF